MHDRPGPGKFEGNGSRRLAEALYEATLTGGCDEEIGSVDELGWYGLITRPHAGTAYVMYEDSNGFFSYERTSLEEGKRAMREIASSYSEDGAE